MGPDLWELFEDGKEDDEIAAIIRLGHYAALPAGVRVVTQFGEIITVRLRRGNIPRVSGASEVASMVAGGTYLGPDVELETAGLPELSESLLATDERRPKEVTVTGHGVVVGVVDWGFDFAHPDFRKPDGSTRIAALWDQRGGKRPDSPKPFDYGVLHDREAIDRALKENDPYAALHYHPADADTGIGCHGTHVASIAAGSGGEGRPTGIAPEAELVVVHNAPWDPEESGKLGDSVTVLEGIDFIARIAGDRPWVVNLSMGTTGDSHDGTTSVEQGFDAAVRGAAGRAICMSAGNYFEKMIHASGQLRPTQERTFVWVINEGSKPTDYNELEVWYSRQDKFEIGIRSPDGSIAARVKVGERAKLMVSGKEVGNVYHRAQEPNNLDNHIHIFLYKEAPPGAWELTLYGADIIDGRFHAWIEREVACPKCQSHFRKEDADPHSTTGSICNGRRTIAVGAYNRHDPELRIGRFSGLGPTRDGRLKPDLCAPGVSVLAARSAPRERTQFVSLLTRMSGTSMAAPHVTGTVALMFQVAPRRLRIEEIHNLLLENAERVSVPEEFPDRIGIGYLDVEAAVEAARTVGGTAQTFKQITVRTPAAASPKPAGKNAEQIEGALLGGVESELVQEFLEGKADSESEAAEAVQNENTFYRIANDITSAFEGGKPGTLNLYDRGVISYGKHQATLVSGTLYAILKRYTELSSSKISAGISGYLDRAKRRDETLRDEEDFIRLLKAAAEEPEMSQAQDEEFRKEYWLPAKKRAAAFNIKSALGYVLLYDTRVQGGLDDVLNKSQARLGGKVGETVQGKEITEQEFLAAFVDERIQRHLRIASYQKKEAAGLNKEAQALEDAATAAADASRAEELRRQAAEKRRKAKQNAANAAALEVSANKTRGPSLKALVDSGDLNLAGDANGKIYLIGKVGVTIAGLKPGAGIDASTSSEAEIVESASEAIHGKRPSEVEIAEGASEAIHGKRPSEVETAQGASEAIHGKRPSEVEIAEGASEAIHGKRPSEVEIAEAASEAIHDKRPAAVSGVAGKIVPIEALGSHAIPLERFEVAALPGAKVSESFAHGLTDSAGRLLEDLLLLRLATPPTVVKIEGPSKSAGEPPEGDQTGQSEFSEGLERERGTPASEVLQSPSSRSGLIPETSAPDPRAARQLTPAKEAAAASEMVSSDSVETDGVEIIELVDQLVAQGGGGRVPAQILHEMLSRAGIAQELKMPGTGRLPSVAEIFAAFAYPGREQLLEQLEQHFEIVALPRTRLEAKICPGDLLIRIGEGNLAHVAVVATPGLWSYDQLPSMRLIPEIRGPGWYVQVIESGERPHTMIDLFARRAADATGWVPYNQMILKPRETIRAPLRENAESETSAAIPDLAEAFNGQVYTTGWTTFMPFELGGKPHYLAYKLLNGAVSIDRIRPGLQPDPATGYPVDVLYPGSWKTGWTAFVPFKLPGDSQTHYLAYKAAEGDVTVDRINPDGKGVTTIWGTPLDASIKWTLGWTAFVPFTLGGRPHYLAYKALTGEVTIDRIKPDGKGVDTIWGTPLDASIKWTLGWTSFVPFTLSGRPHYLAYKTLTAEVTIDRIKPDGKGVDTIWGTPLDPSIKWTLGWTSFMPFTQNGRPHYLAYKVLTGDVTIDRIKPDGKGVDTIWGTPLEPSLKWAQGWSTLMPFTMGGKPHYFAYATSSGWVAAESIAEEMLRCVSPGVSSDDPAALSISAVGTANYNSTVTLAGRSIQVSGNVFYPGKSAGSNVPFNTALAGRGPIVFIAHGNHSTFSNPADRSDERANHPPPGFIPIRSHEGYVYFQRLLAQMGIISVSVDCNRFNGHINLDPTNINNRADLVLGSLVHFQSLDSGGDPTFGGHIDFANVGLLGHSRGGEVVLRVAELLALPGIGVAGVQIKGVISLAPTDSGATSGKPAGFAFMTILPAGDGDVVPSDGAKFYDQGAADPFKCQLYVDHTNHNFFNREWVNDEMSRSVTPVMSRPEHEAILSAYGCAFFRSVLLGQSMRKFLEGLELPPGVRSQDVHISFERTGSLTIDDYEGHDIRSNSLGKSNIQAGGLTADQFSFAQGSGSFNSTFYGNTHGMVAQSATASGRFRWNLAGPMDLTSREIRVRAAEVYNGASVPTGATGFKLGLMDAAGKRAFIDSKNVGALPRPYDRRSDDLAPSGSHHDFTKTMPSSLRFPGGCFARAVPGFDATRVSAILLLVDRKDGRALAFDQLQIVS